MVDCGAFVVACVVVKNVPRLSVFFGCCRVRQFVARRVRGSDNGNSRFPSGMTTRKATSKDTLPQEYTLCWGSMARFGRTAVHAFSGAEGASEIGEGFDDLCGPLREFVVAEGAVVGLEDGAEEEGVDAGVFFR